MVYIVYFLHAKFLTLMSSGYFHVVSIAKSPVDIFFQLAALFNQTSLKGRSKGTFLGLYHEMFIGWIKNLLYIYQIIEEKSMRGHLGQRIVIHKKYFTKWFRFT